VFRHGCSHESMRPWRGNLDVGPWAGIGHDGNLRVTGNGGYGGAGTGNWGESVLRLTGPGVVVDSFTPAAFRRAEP
jgi:hypothetical protein